MVVIEDVSKRVWAVCGLVNQSRQHQFKRWRLRGFERRQDSLCDTGLAEAWDRLHSSDEVGPEPRQVVVAFVQRDPGDV